jgi:RNA polymerase sigma-70 factor, ECF subfamily
MPGFHDPDVLMQLHERLLNGDRVASEICCELLLPSLTAEISRKFPKVDPQIVCDGVIDAILDYCDHPEKTDVTNGRLDRLLATASWRNVANLYRGEKRRKARERKAGAKKQEADVAFDPVAGKIQQEDQERHETQLTAMFDALTDPRDRKILSLRSQGEKRTSVYARILEIAHLSTNEQETEVKKNKDRIMKFLKRKGFKP